MFYDKPFTCECGLGILKHPYDKECYHPKRSAWDGESDACQWTRKNIVWFCRPRHLWPAWLKRVLRIP